MKLYRHLSKSGNGLVFWKQNSDIARERVRLKQDNQPINNNWPEITGSRLWSPKVQQPLRELVACTAWHRALRRIYDYYAQF